MLLAGFRYLPQGFVRSRWRPFPTVSESCFIPFCRRYAANILWFSRPLPSVGYLPLQCEPPFKVEQVTQCLFTGAIHDRVCVRFPVNSKSLRHMCIWFPDHFAFAGFSLFLPFCFQLKKAVSCYSNGYGKFSLRLIGSAIFIARVELP